MLSLEVIAQQTPMPLNHDILNHINRYADRQGSHVHTALKPYNESELLDNIDAEAAKDLALPDYNGYFSGDSTALGKEGFSLGWKRGDLLSVQKRKFYLGINPIVDAQYVLNHKEDNNFLYATYGAQLRMHLTKKLSLSGTYYGHFGGEPNYVAEQIIRDGQQPGFNHVEKKGNNFTSSEYEALITFSPVKQFTMQGGYGKNFWGEGYRSMYISDNATAYPYVLLTTNFWKIKYAYLLNFMVSGTLDTLNYTWNYESKFGNFHYLSLDVAKWMQFGFFEGVVWRNTDSLGRKRGMEFNYLNPMVMIRPVEFALGSPDNVQLGFNFKFKPSNNNIIYFQTLLDDLDIKRARGGKGFYRTKIAMQMGYKAYDILGVKHLDFQTEFNLVRPFVYAHKVAVQNYAHANMALAHPLGANFYEIIAIARYQWDRVSTKLAFNYAKQGRDDGSDATPKGNNIFISDYEISPDLNSAYGQKFLQGNKTRIINLDFRVGYMLHPYSRTKIELFSHLRNFKNEDYSSRNLLLGIGLSTSLFNRYTDF
jgi:hypothetical protein